MAVTGSDDKDISSKDSRNKDISPNKDNDEHGTMRVVRSGSTSQESNKLLVSGENYFSIHFSGCGELIELVFFTSFSPFFYIYNTLHIPIVFKDLCYLIILVWLPPSKTLTCRSVRCF